MLTALLLLAAADAPDQRRDDQMQAFQARRSGRPSLREIERRVIPQVPGAEYLGADYDADEGVYTLKFVRDGQVIWVQADGATGQVIGRSGR